MNPAKELFYMIEYGIPHRTDEPGYYWVSKEMEEWYRAKKDQMHRHGEKIERCLDDLESMNEELMSLEEPVDCEKVKSILKKKSLYAKALEDARQEREKVY